MPFTNKLDTNVISITGRIDPSGPLAYTSTQGTIELNDVIGYYTFVKLNGAITTFTALVMSGAGLPIIVDETYATIDGLINP